MQRMHPSPVSADPCRRNINFCLTRTLKRQKLPSFRSLSLLIYVQLWSTYARDQGVEFEATKPVMRGKKENKLKETSFGLKKKTGEGLVSNEGRRKKSAKEKKTSPWACTQRHLGSVEAEAAEPSSHDMRMDLGPVKADPRAK